MIWMLGLGLLFYLLLGGLVFLAIERLTFEMASPNSPYSTAVYFLVVSITTVGYGDVTLKCPGSRALLFFYVAAGLPFAVTVAGLVARRIYALTNTKAPEDDDRFVLQKCRFVFHRFRWLLPLMFWFVILILCTLIFLPTPYATINRNATPPNITILCPVNATIWGFDVAFYYSWVSIATVGFGDFTPKTPIAQAITAFVLLMGVGYFALLVTKFGDFIEQYFEIKYDSLYEGHKDDEVPLESTIQDDSYVDFDSVT